MVVVLSGPSGVGKDAVLEGMKRLDPLLRQCVTVTTRPPRPGEVDGRDYHFRTPEEFDRLVKEEYFLEWAPVHTARYGSPKSGVESLRQQGFDVVLKIDVQGGAALSSKLSDLVSIFIAPPSISELQRRQETRGTEAGAELEKRREDAAKELACLPSYQYVVVNNVLEQAVDDVLCIIRAERMRVSRLSGFL